MPWLNLGDLFATHPFVMALMRVVRADERTTNEVTGFVTRCGSQAAGHMTDYRVDLGTATLMGGARAELLLRQAVEAGMMTCHGRGKARFWRIVEHDDFLHMRSAEEVEWDRQRKRDAANPELTVPVRVRDGDSCRYCGQVVFWSNRKGGRGGTYDHREPGKPATVLTYVVACRACNSSRKDDPAADERMPLRPAPDAPYYSESTVKWLRGQGVTVHPTDPPKGGTTSNLRPGTAAAAPDNAHPLRPSPSTDTRTTRTSQMRPGDHDPDNATLERGSATRTKALRSDNAHPLRPEHSSDNAHPSATRERAPHPDNAHPASLRPGDGHAPDNALPFDRGHDRPPPGWTRDAADLQIPADPSRKEGSGPGRVGSGRDGPGAEPAPAGSPAHLPTPSPPENLRPRRGRRGKRTEPEREHP